jgi:Cytochrome bd terminal oxidase subunit I
VTAVPGLTVSPTNWPVAGNQIPVAVLFTLHIAIAEFSLGAITLAACMETISVSTGNEWHLRYARAAANAYYLVFSLGATLGVFAVTVIIGLWGVTWGVLLNRLFLLFAIAFGLFLILAPLLVWYRNSFGRMAPRAHAILGWAVWFWQTAFMVLIVIIDAYLIDPAHDALPGGFLNPPYVPLLLHRLIGNVSWTALFLAGLAVLLMTRRTDLRERAFQSWAARLNLRIGLATAIAMPVLGFALMEVLRTSVPGYFVNLVRGDAAYLFVIQAAALGVLFVSANLALAGEMARERRSEVFSRVCVVLTVVAFTIGLLPGGVLGDSTFWVRYAGIGAGLVVTLAHLLARSAPLHPKPVYQPAPGAYAVLPFSTSSVARRALVVCGVVAMGLSLYMGVMKEEARGAYVVNGELTQQDAHGLWNPQGIYP